MNALGRTQRLVGCSLGLASPLAAAIAFALSLTTLLLTTNDASAQAQADAPARRSQAAPAAAPSSESRQQESQGTLTSLELSGHVTQVAGVSGARFDWGYGGAASIGLNVFGFGPSVETYLYGGATALEIRNAPGTFWLAEVGAGIRFLSHATGNEFINPFFGVQGGVAFNWLDLSSAGASQINATVYPAVAVTPGVQLRLLDSAALLLAIEAHYIFSAPRPLSIFRPTVGVRISL